MGALANAAQLRVDPTFRDWVTTAVVYVSRNVITNDSAAPVADQPVRAALARTGAFTPDSIAPLFIAAIAADPAIVAPAPTGMGASTTSPELEQPIIDRVTGAWTTIAKLMFPNGV